jgi:hypothetical protein
MEDGQVTVLVLFDFSRAFDMVIDGLLLSKLMNLQYYSDVGELVSKWCDPVCEMWLKEVFRWESDVWCSAGVSPWFTFICFSY